jgi:hypothetical protein
LTICGRLAPRAVEQARSQVLGLERLIVEETVDVEVVDREVGAGLDRARQKAGRGNLFRPIAEVANLIALGKKPVAAT